MKKPKPQKKGQPDWLATYADMFTLLMCFFVLLFSMSNVDEEKFSQLAQSLALSPSIFTNESILLDAGKDFMPHQTVMHPEDTNPEEPDEPSTSVTMTQAEVDEVNDMRQKRELLTGMASDFMTYFAEQNIPASEIMADNEGEGGIDGPDDKSEVNVYIDPQGNYVGLVFDGGILFDSGRANLKEEAIKSIDAAGEIMLRYSDHVIRIEGHTDNVPMSSAQYPSNLYLSSARAISVVEHLIKVKGFGSKTLSPEGMGENWPRETNDTAEGRAKNRRVEIKIYAQKRENGEIVLVS